MVLIPSFRSTVQITFSLIQRSSTLRLVLIPSFRSTVQMGRIQEQKGNVGCGVLIPSFRSTVQIIIQTGTAEQRCSHRFNPFIQVYSANKTESRPFMGAGRENGFNPFIQVYSANTTHRNYLCGNDLQARFRMPAAILPQIQVFPYHVHLSLQQLIAS